MFSLYHRFASYCEYSISSSQLAVRPITVKATGKWVNSYEYHHHRNFIDVSIMLADHNWDVIIIIKKIRLAFKRKQLLVKEFNFPLGNLREALSLFILCAPVFIFTPVSSALLGTHVVVYRSCCRYLPYSIHFSEFMPFFFIHEKTDKTQEFLKTAIFVWYENDRRRLLGINSVTASLRSFR